MNQEQNQNLADDEIDLKELLYVIWKGKLWIISMTSIALIIAIAVAISLPNIYRSEVLLVPVSSENKGLGGLASSLGGLASLAGVSLPSSGSPDKTTTALEVIKSRRFFATFMEKYNVLVPLIAASGWDSVKNELQINPDIYDMKRNLWLRSASPPREAKPSILEAHQIFLNTLFVAQDKETGFVTISIEHFSPYVAKEWVEALVMEINETTRQQDVQQAERSIDYLKDQIQSTQLAELRAVFFQLIQSQTEKIMLANASPEYLFKTLDPAVVPELKIKPKRPLIVVFGALLGSMFGVLIVFVRHFLIKKDDLNSGSMKHG